MRNEKEAVHSATRSIASQRFRGIYSIPVTPFSEDSNVDFDGLADVVEFTIKAGANGLVVPVIVSEFYTLTDKERRRVLDVTIQAAERRVPVIGAVSAPSIPQAAEFASHAARVGADAVIAVPPYVRRATWTEVKEYFRVIAEASGLPVFLQNAENPAGTPLTATQIEDLTENVEQVSWVKEETLASSQLMSALLDNPGSVVSGVMGGKGGRFLLDEYPRGICGTMPGCEFTDIHAALWRALEANDVQRAHQLHRVLLPLVSMEDQYGGAGFCKEVLRRRGVLQSVTVREPATPKLDRVASEMLDLILGTALDDLDRLSEPV